MTKRVTIEPITVAAFAPYGDVMQAEGDPTKLINQGKCGRYHDLARLDFSDGQAGISIFKGEIETLPLVLQMVERHPQGSQAFVPMSADPFLVVVARDEDGVPTEPRAFVTEPGQAINFHKGTWHGVLTPLSGQGCSLSLIASATAQTLKNTGLMRVTSSKDKNTAGVKPAQGII